MWMIDFDLERMKEVEQRESEDDSDEGRCDEIRSRVDVEQLGPEPKTGPRDRRTRCQAGEEPRG